MTHPPDTEGLRRFAAEHDPGVIADADDVKRLAVEFRSRYPGERCTTNGLLVMAHHRDPFNITPGRLAKAEWFADMYVRARDAGAPVTHLRRLHYWLGSTGQPRWDGQPYRLSDGDDDLSAARTTAEVLELLDLSGVQDRRNRDALTRMIDHDEPPEPGVWLMDASLATPYVPSRFTMPTTRPVGSGTPPTVHGYTYSPGYEAEALYVIVEKSTQNDLLIPACSELGISLVTLAGFLSTTVLLAIAKHGGDKPIRIGYISDCDQGGNDMPRHLARILESMLATKRIDRDVAVHRLALTWDQADEFDLPMADCDPGDRRRWGHSGRVELDALEALRPGALDRLVREWAAPYRTGAHRQALRDASLRANQATREAWEEHTAPFKRRAEALNRLIRFVTRRHAALLEQAADYNADIGRLERLSLRLATEADALVRGFSVDLPERPVQVRTDDSDIIDGWLMNSRRNYLEQLVAYRDHDQSNL